VEETEGARPEAESGGHTARTGSRLVLGAAALAMWLVSEAVPPRLRGVVLGLLFVAFVVTRLVLFATRTVRGGSQRRIERRLDEGEDKTRISLASSDPIEPR
jgi:Flp pilus assembly protein TadB